MKHPRSSPSLPGDWKLPARDADRFGHSPTLRLAAVFGLFVLSMVAVAVRLAYLQLHLAPRYLAHLNQPRYRTEYSDAPRARILAADGTVLAEDETLVSLAVHYRWLEEPADESWLTREARRRLNPTERRDRHRLDQEKLDVLADRARRWQNLVEVAGKDRKSLREAAGEIQQRVETIAGRVNSRYRRTREAIEPDDGAIASDAPWWRRAGFVLLDALRADPEPEETHVLTIPEQEGYHPLIAPVSPAVVAAVEGDPDRFPDVKVVIQTKRRYPLGRLACHLLGHVGPVTPSDLARQNGGDRLPAGEALRPTDWIGQQGLERQYEAWLRGRRGEVRQMVSAGGEMTELSKRKPEPGSDLVLSIDPALERHAEQVLDAAVSGRNGAVAVVMDVHNGKLLAAAAAPGFDLNLIRSEDPGAWEALNRHPGRPLFNRVIGANLPPGSTFKALSAIAFVESGLVHPDSHYYCQGYLRRPDQLRCLIYTKYGVGHGDTSLVGAIKESCNVFFYHHAERVGPSRLCHWADALGFGKPTGIDLPHESGGFLPTPENVRERLGHAWRRGDTPRLAIGQASLTVTPLQIARLMAAIANGGTLVTPHLVRTTSPHSSPHQAEEGEGLPGPLPEPAPPRQVEGLNPSKLKPIRDGLRAVVQEQGGTGHRAVYLDDVEVAGKSGTAETGPGRGSHAWFAGYVPADNPRFAFAVVLEHAGSGGAEAGPIAKSLIEKMLELGYFGPPRPTDVALRESN